MNDPSQIVAFTVRVAKKERDDLAALAEREHRSLGAEARKAITTYLEMTEKEAA